MAVGIIQALVAFVILLATSLSDSRREDGRLTRSGYLILVAGLIALVAGLFQAVQAYRAEAREPHRFATDRVHIRLDAHYDQAYASNDSVRSSAPPALNIQNAYLGKTPLRFELVTGYAVYRPRGYRASPRASLVYQSQNVDLQSPKRSVPYAYFWELEGEAFRFSIPVSEFTALRNDLEWRYTVEVRVGDNVFEAEADYRGEFEVLLEDLHRE